MDSGKDKPSDFRLSQALVYRVVRKGGCGDFTLCGLSPPVSEGRPAGLHLISGDHLCRLTCEAI
jgi:hypothetical protein